MAKSQLGSMASSRKQLGLRGVPVLLYHGLLRSEDVTPGPRERKYWVSLPQFQEHLHLIRQAGGRVALLEELWSDTLRALEVGKPPVALTFDDGHSSDYGVAFPALLEAGVRADFFVNTAMIGQPGYLDWRQIMEMQSTGMAFHSHSHDHVDLSRLTERELEDQLGESKRQLEDRLGCPVEFLAAPYGLLNRSVVQMAHRLGYRAVCTSWGWPARPGGTTISRVAVYCHTTRRGFQKLLAGNTLWYAARAARTVSLYLPKRILLRYRPAQLGVRILEEQA